MGGSSNFASRNQDACRPQKGQNKGLGQNQLVFLKKTVDDLCRLQCAGPFLEPVDPILLKIPDYFQIIKKPMDLSTIKQQLKDNYYLNVKQFIDDMNLMVENCIDYNGALSPVGKLATKLKKSFEHKMSLFPRKITIFFSNREANDFSSVRVEPPPTNTTRKIAQPANTAASEQPMKQNTITFGFFGQSACLPNQMRKRTLSSSSSCSSSSSSSCSSSSSSSCSSSDEEVDVLSTPPKRKCPVVEMPRKTMSPKPLVRVQPTVRQPFSSNAVPPPKQAENTQEEAHAPLPDHKQQEERVIPIPKSKLLAPIDSASRSSVEPPSPIDPRKESKEKRKPRQSQNFVARPSLVYRAEEVCRGEKRNNLSWRLIPIEASTGGISLLHVASLLTEFEEYIGTEYYSEFVAYDRAGNSSDFRLPQESNCKCKEICLKKNVNPSWLSRKC